MQLRASYWALPDHDRPHRFVPLRRRGPIRWYARSLLILSGPGRRLVPHLLALAGPRLLRLVAPSQVLVGVRSPGRGAGRACRTPDGADRFVLTSGNDDRSRTVVCEFDPGSVHPDRVRKVPTHPAANEVARLEQESLSAAVDRLPVALAGGVPKPLGIERIGALISGTETGVPGVALTVSSGGGNRRRALADLELAAAWLRGLGAATRTEDRWDQTAVSTWLVTPGERGATADGARSLAAHLGNMALAHPDLVLVRTWRHHDFGPWNLFRDRDRLYVVDWEWWPPPGDRSGPALADLVYLVTYWLHAAGGHHDLSAQAELSRQLWIEPRPRSALVREARALIADEAAALGLAPAAIPLVVGHTWLDQVAHVADRQRELGVEGRPPPHAAVVVQTLAREPDTFVRTTTEFAGSETPTRYCSP